MAAFWSIACLAGLWGFLFSTVGFIVTGFPVRGVFDRRALRFGAALLVCFVVWIIGMSHA